MDFDTIVQIVASVLFLISIVFGMKWRQAKALLKEVAEALTVTSNALEDDDIMPSEREALLREWRDVIIAARELLRK